jgi:hypothetical protein
MAQQNRWWERAQVAALAATAAAVYFVSLGKTALLDWDEALYAEASKESIRTHHWLTPLWSWSSHGIVLRPKPSWKKMCCRNCWAAVASGGSRRTASSSLPGFPHCRNHKRGAFHALRYPLFLFSFFEDDRPNFLGELGGYFHAVRGAGVFSALIEHFLLCFAASYEVAKNSDISAMDDLHRIVPCREFGPGLFVCR